MRLQIWSEYHEFDRFTFKKVSHGAYIKTISGILKIAFVNWYVVGYVNHISRMGSQSSLCIMAECMCVYMWLILQSATIFLYQLDKWTDSEKEGVSYSSIPLVHLIINSLLLVLIYTFIWNDNK